MAVITVFSVASRGSVEDPVESGIHHAHEVTALRVSEDVKARMQRSLGEGALLIAPGRMVRVGGAERLAWWRVDLRSGEVPAILDNGLHQTGVEYAPMNILSIYIGSTITLLAFFGLLLYLDEMRIQQAFEMGTIYNQQEMKGDCAWQPPGCSPTCGYASSGRRPCGPGEQRRGPGRQPR